MCRRYGRRGSAYSDLEGSDQWDASFPLTRFLLDDLDSMAQRPIPVH